MWVCITDYYDQMNALVNEGQVKGMSEIISRILRPYNIRVAHRLITTLRHLLTKFKQKEQTRRNLQNQMCQLPGDIYW